MKLNKLFLLSFFVIVFCTPNFAINRVLEDSVEVIEDFEKLYHSGDFYFGGQPSLETLQWLKTQGVETVINLRSESEIEKFTKTGFNEKNILKEIGVEYISIPMSGRASYTRETLEQFADALSAAEGKVYIHCAGCGRVTYVMMAYLIEYQNYTVNK